MEQSNIMGSFIRGSLVPNLIGGLLGGAIGQTPVPDSAKAGRWGDKNGDGIIQKDEVTPGSQLEKRFATRDKNGDGQLSPDEYYLPK